MGINDFRKHQCLRHNNPGDPSLLPELPSQGENTHPLLAPELMHILMETKSEDSRKERKNLNGTVVK